MADFWKIQEALEGPHGDNATLYARTKQIVDGADFPTAEAFSSEVISQFVDRCHELRVPVPHINVAVQMAAVAAGLYAGERLKDLSPNPADYSRHAYTYSVGQLRDLLLLHQRKALRPTDTVQALTKCLVASFISIARHLPPIAHHQSQDAPATTTVSLLDVLPNAGEVIEAALEPLSSPEAKDLGLFRWFHITLKQNADQLQERSGKNKSITISQYDGPDIVGTYLRDTAFDRIFNARVELCIPEETRFEHTHIVGGTGAGKTTLIQQFLLDNLATEDPPAMVIIDPKGLLIERIQKLDVFHPNNGRLKDRLIIIDPTHSSPPALNMFHPGTERKRTYSEVIRQQIENQAVSNFAYVFSSVGSTLTDKQSVPFTFLIRLLFAIPNATILTFLEVLDDPAASLQESDFAPYIERLDPITYGFFDNEYYDRNFSNSRKEIKARLYSILMRPQLVAMFSAPERKLDMFDCLQSKKIVLVNTAMNALGRESSALLGRYMIALTLNAAFERISVKKSQWNTAYLIVDEFQEFSDERKTPELLRLAREYNLGVVIAHQQMHAAEFSNDLRNAISTNTAIKYAASVEAMDQGYMARDLRCEPSFLTAQRRTKTHAQFACFVRNFTDRAVSVSVPLGNIQACPQMSDDSLHELLQRNADALSSPVSAPPSAASSIPSAPAATSPTTRKPSSAAAPTLPPKSGSASDGPESGSKW